jgi:hypothetical protein
MATVSKAFGGIEIAHIQERFYQAAGSQKQDQRRDKTPYSSYFLEHRFLWLNQLQAGAVVTQEIVTHNIHLQLVRHRILEYSFTDNKSTRCVREKRVGHVPELFERQLISPF